MSDQIRLTDNLAYFQRVGFAPAALSTNAPATSAAPTLRRLVRIDQIGRLQKAVAPHPTASTDQPARLPSEDLLIGLYGYKIALAFLILGTPQGVAIHLGTWSPSQESATAGVLDARQAILGSVLAGLYPAVSQTPAEVQPVRWPLAGLALGVPTAKPQDPLDGALPIDRLIRALTGAQWTLLVLAQPVDESATTRLRNDLVNEMRATATAAKAELVPGPLADHYTELLKVGLKGLTQGQAVGAWRTNVYLLGDGAGYYRLASVFRSIFSGEQSLPEPVRVWDSPAAANLATSWSLPDAAMPAGPGLYHHPFQYQTLLTSAQLATYIHLPQIETSGFSINVVPNFDVVPPAVKKDDRVLSLGKTLQWNRPTFQNYDISLNALKRHAFIPGVTGSGKTNTVFHLLAQAARLDVRFMVIEPAKAEYRALLLDPNLKGRLQIFTPGNEIVSPFRVNPFEVVGWPKNSVGVHLDLLRSVFSASFGMWTPLPQVLERCLYRIYEDRGWNITTNTNPRLDDKSDVADAFPTLSDLIAKVDEATRELGYEEKITSDIHAALSTRINALRTGGKGSMLDVQRSLPMPLLLDHPTILELEGMGDDDDKAFMIGLLLIRLAEYRRAGGERKELQHILVIEEAHRLLANIGPRGGEEQADPRGKAVETFTNLLAEVRAYGQGIIVADQVPTKLAPDVIKNTNLKVAHRIVAADDREALAGAMAMDEQQARALTNLARGDVAVFGEDDDAPVLVHVGLSEYKTGKIPSHDDVTRYMTTLKTLEPYKTIVQPLAAYVDLSIMGAQEARDAARALVDTPGFQRELVRFLISIYEDDQAFNRLWDQLLVRARGVQRRSTDAATLDGCVMLYAAQWFASRRGAQAGWLYTQTAELEQVLRAMLLARLAGRDATNEQAIFREYMARLHQRLFVPFPGCASICTQGPLCMYRYSVADLVAAAPAQQLADWNAAYNQGGTEQLLQICQDKADQLVELKVGQQGAAMRIGLCYAQHMLAERFGYVRESALNDLLDQAAMPNGEGEKDERFPRSQRAA